MDGYMFFNMFAKLLKDDLYIIPRIELRRDIISK